MTGFTQRLIQPIEVPCTWRPVGEGAGVTRLFRQDITLQAVLIMISSLCHTTADRGLEIGSVSAFSPNSVDLERLTGSDMAYVGSRVRQVAVI